MKLPLISLLALVLPVSAQTDLEKLRTDWKEARAQALEPVDRKYLAALEALKARLTREGKLEEAVAVGSEIEAVGVAGGVVGAAADTVWKWHAGQYLFLRANGTASLYGASPQAYAGMWEFVSPRKVALTMASPPPARRYDVTFDDGKATGRVVSSTGTWTITRQ